MVLQSTPAIFKPTFCFLLTLFLSVSAATCSKQLTHEKCNTTADCSQDLTDTQCFGRPNPSAESMNCTDPSVNVDFCRCIPIFTHYCEDNRDCLDEEYCGISQRSGNQLCVGCHTLTDTGINKGFIPVQPFETKNNRCFNQGESHPPCGYAGDFCSPSMPCHEDYKCISDVEGQFFECNWESTRCTCGKISSNSSPELNTFDPQPCAVDDNCRDKEREICAMFTKTNQTFCVSCDVARLQHDIVPISESNKCDDPNFVQRPEPMSYIEGPNGRTMDRCLNDQHCTGNRKCLTRGGNDNVNFINCENRRGDLCYCRPDTLTSCSTGSDCDKGESCITLTGTPPPFFVTRQCVSNALFDALSSRQHEVIGDRTRPSRKGPGLTDDKCKFDWDCSFPRRCTHVADVYGRCAGRSNCKCKPLVNPECSSNEDCTEGEQCVTAVDASFKPFCQSKTASIPYFFQISDSRLEKVADPTPIPSGSSYRLIGDPCLTSDDCEYPRQCYHHLDTPLASPSPGSQTRCDKSGGKLRNCICNSAFGTEGRNCTTTADCKDNREICTLYEDQVPGGKIQRVCMSRLAFDADTDSGMQQRIEFGPPQSIQPSPSPSNTPEIDESPEAKPTDEPAPCIDVKLLKNYRQSDLVYRKHLRSAVLCDEHGSCATPGHMVVYDNTPMSMKSYCAKHARCSKRTAWVNNPRMMKTGIRVWSETTGLEMTVFSARYESWAEETILRQIIRLGA